MAETIDTKIYEQLISSAFSPASEISDAELMLTTSDIIERIADYNGEILPKKTVVDMMNKMGYICKPDCSMNFVWLLLQN